MIIGVGADITEIRKMTESMRNERFLRKIFLQNEIDRTINTGYAAQRFAAYFAAKESFFKAMGTGIAKGFSFKDVEVCDNRGGKPHLIINKKIHDYLKKKWGNNRIITHLSLSHGKDHSLATVIIEAR